MEQGLDSWRSAPQFNPRCPVRTVVAGFQVADARDPLSARRLVGPWWSKLVGNDSADGLPRAPSFRGSRLIPTSSKCELLLPKGLSITTRHRLWAVLIAFLVLVALGCRGTLGVDESTIVHPTRTATPLPTPTPPPHRMDCGAIASSKTFLNDSEQDWFIASCLTGPTISISYNELPGIGARVMEIHRVDTAICGSGLVSITVLHDYNMEDFSYLFRSFCTAYLNPSTLPFPPPPFECPSGQKIEVLEVFLEYLTGSVRQEVEVLCSVTVELGEGAS